MATVKKSKKSKIIAAVIAIILIVGIVVAALVIKSSNSKTEVSLTTISTDSITQTVNSTGTVSSGTKKDYSAGVVATVKEVFVKTGDSVNKGDVIATFDTSSLDSQIANLQATYNDSVTSYNNAVTNQENAVQQLHIVNSKIAQVEQAIELVENGEEVNADNMQMTDAQYADSGIGGIISGSGTSTGDFTSQIDDLIAAINSLQDSIDGINDRVDELSSQLESIANAVNRIDPDSITLTALQIELTGLTAQKEVYEVLAQGTTVSAQKQVMNASKSALDTVSAANASLSAGWKADFDGVITACNINAGAQTTALETGVTLENMDSRVVTLSLGEYDVHKVKVGMEATVKTAYGEYVGEVATIAPTATGGSSSSVVDSVGSMAGISGLSSLTSTGAGVEVTVIVNNPDDNIIIGFDADVEIVTGTYNENPCVPIESIVLEKEGTYVYLYNEEEGTVTKTSIEVGATSDTSYEIVSGLNVGDRIVSTPQTDYEEETFKVKVVDKTK